ncbi:protein of unknown function [Taphrina deformans PYCC 5710]|uniref:PHD finger and BAH domain protein n=1 Tax=Taphrina deformans (strain PYCC 5710 / ATCC 11124 / CBS 356.35 / IMI 108563 / JCM 9778 / NBRC 8474) TaxID=1097556 RepID=S0BE63_TAPDE|nr:protein of unknown function [Taphrina deformans PYCC 5710]|eukprot:CCG84884.1 protein of unknown function [Taphrina deformans PYCC 5710]
MGEATEPIEDAPVEGIEQSGKKLQVRSSLPLGKDAVHPPLESSCGPSTSNPERWPYRYLGIHCNVNDAVDHDDRIYPRAASRIGQKYQAAVQEWPGRPIQYFERSRRPIKRTVKAMKGKRSDQRASIDSAPLESMRNHPREEPSAVGQYFTGSNEECEENTKSLNPTSMTAAERPLWLQEKPTNYLARGEGQTAECIWSPSDELSESEYTEYLQLAKPIANDLGIKWYTPNFLDAALRASYINDHSLVNAIASLKQIDRLSLKEPSFSPSELARFENSVRKHGSELAQVARDVTTRSVAECVRLYYTWKKTSKGGRIWALSEARKPKIDQTGTKTTSQSEDLGESSDDSAYDQAKANKLKMSFQCKFCSGATSKRWRRAPGSVVSDKSISALCDRCADLWRKYAVSWEPPEDVFKKLNESAYRNRKKRVEAELVKELPINGLKPEKLQEDSLDTMKHNKKAKRTEKSKLSERSTPVDDCLPCSICESKEDTGLLTCCDCSLVVHRACYGTFVDDEIRSSWKCDPCENSSSPHASTDYGCVLCPFRESDDSKCVGPVRRTAGNNWAHVLCATWNPKLKLEMSSNSFTIQGITAIPLQQWQSICAVCDTNAGACVNCTTCDMAVHVMCAHTAGYVMAFDVQPIKSSQSRRDSLTLVRLGSETGLMTPVLHCRDHDLKRVTIHPPSRSSADIGVSALALYNRTYKTSLRNRFRRGPSNSHYHNRQDNLENIQLKIHELRSPKFAREDNRATAGSTSFDQCARCKTDFSPCFYSEAIPDLSTRSTNGVDEACMTSKLCHRCYWIEHMQTGNFTPMPVLDTQIKEY